MQNTHCPNCNTAIESTYKYCHHCGQDLHEVKRPFKHFILEFLEGLFHFDNKIWHTIKRLFQSPGFVIKEYNQNKKARFVPPVRLYIFFSVLYFIAISNTVEQSIGSIRKVMNVDLAKMDTSNKSKKYFQVSFFKETKVPEYLAKQLLLDTSITVSKVDSLFKLSNISSNKLNNRFLVAIAKFKQGKLSDKEIAYKYKSNTSKMIFLLMPIFAFLIWLFMNPIKNFYAEAFIFSLYFHSFFLIILLIGWLINYTIHVDVNEFLIALAAIYFVVSMKIAYAKNWLTAVLFSVIILLLYAIIFAIFYLLSITYSLL